MKMKFTYNHGKFDKEVDAIEVTQFATAEESPYRTNTRNVLYEENGIRKAVLIDDNNEILHTVITQ